MSSKRRVEEIKLQMPWGHISAKTWGSAKSPGVLVAHGILDNAGAYDRLIPMLPENYYYVVPDLPGHGLSSPLPTGIQLDFMNYVLAVRLILDALKWKTCVYLGHSFGSQLGLFTSFMHPGRITKLMCLDGFLPFPTDQNLLEMMQSIQNTAIQALSAKSPPRYTKEDILYTLRNRRQFPLNSAAAGALFDRATTKVSDNLYEYNRDYRLRTPTNPLLDTHQFLDLTRRVKIPVLIILARSSWIHNPQHISAFENLLQKASTNFSVVTVPGNHDVHNNNPENVAPHISKFLNAAGKSKL